MVAAHALLGHQHVPVGWAEEEHGKAAGEAEKLAHTQMMALWQASMGHLLRDPLLCNLLGQVTPEEIASLIMLEYDHAGVHAQS